MMAKKLSKNRLKNAVVGSFFAIITLFSSVSGAVAPQVVYAEPVEEEVVTIETTETVEETEPTGDVEIVEEVVEERPVAADEEVNESNGTVVEENNEGSIVKILSSDGDAESSCKNTLSGLGWLICPATGLVSKAVDWLYKMIREFLVINPINAEDGQPVYEVWKYIRNITNIVFIIFFLIIIYSQITGYGINNYGIKKALPKLIVTAILVNLSFIICALLIDVSNVVGMGLRNVFESVEASVSTTVQVDINMADLYEALAGGIAIAGISIMFSPGSIFMLIPLLLSGLVAVASGLITIALRQAVVILLVMIAPLALVANILPNTEPLFVKWKNLLTKMLVFYPMFSLLFGAAHLAGWAIIVSAKDGFILLLGAAVQILPLFLAWNLMKMSGTALETVNNLVRRGFEKPLAATRAWADSRRGIMNAQYMQFGNNPASHLRKYLDNRRALREHTQKSMEELRKNEANTYVQRKIAAGYDGKKAKSTEDNFKPNKYTKLAKDLSSSKLENEYVTMDTEHVISNYGNYYVDRKLRDNKRYDKYRKGIGAEDLKKLRAEDEDYQRNKKGGEDFLELYRAQMTKEHDAEADINFATGVFLKPVDANPENPDWDRYNHYVLSSAGGLGEARQDRVLGKVISRAAGVEAAQRRDISYIGAKWAVPKYPLRNMAIGYHVDSNGYAIDKDNNRIESERGYLLRHDPEKLWWWEQVDENYGPYFDWYDENGRFVTKVYKSNSPAMKELLSNFDIPINDPVNNLYSILTGIDPGEESSKPAVPEGLSDIGKLNMKYIGLGKLKTTLSRSLGVFKEKNSAFGPMVAEMIKMGIIRNYTDLNVAYLDSLNKTTKPGNFNIQDGDAIEMMTRMIDKSQWAQLFREDELSATLNIDKERIKGRRYDENGNMTEISPEESEYADLMKAIEEKYAAPAAVKMVAMMARITPNTLDNQKISTLKKWQKLAETAEENFGDVIEKEGYKLELEKVKRRFSDRINRDRNGGRNNGSSSAGGGNAGSGGGNSGGSISGTNGGSVAGGSNSDGADGSESEADEPEALNEHNDPNQWLKPARENHLVAVDGIYNESLDSYDFVQRLEDYCLRNDLGDAWDEFRSTADEGVMTKEQLYEIAVRIISKYEN